MQIKTNELIEILKNSRTHSLERIKALEINLFKYKRVNTKPPKQLTERIANHDKKIETIKKLEDELKQSNQENWKF
ncbi:TPA: hypothetical protein ACGXZO_000438 [Listeria monocytogenes]|uniref:hypothetical protein n=1 Tax=Listeria monocytogenes TaxID=1639 RepID=UPI0010B81B82|nr:hypothetical protein [Listeria monocytogenes]EAD3319006.1 hypothetical protein [Listeria monocytogenes]EAF2786623.1 hypothetical protein [Listeria monocytogenes]EIR8177633.1 hypothetical protein [Listeria monocytogenes]MED6084903.1 hypothetical protein [Listeria monocytogenes]HDU6517297.1 hypothetical protein [Listeria monocytogenes]